MASRLPPRDEEQGGSSRRREILIAAIDLFRERGYHATGMNDIGQAVGMTGPALYRHFAGKEDILETALMNASDYMQRRVGRIVDSNLAPRETLEQLVADLARTVIDYPAVVSIAVTERRHMSRRAQAIYDRSARLRETEWVGPLLELREELSKAHAELLVRVAQNMIASSVIGGPQLPAARRLELLRGAAMRLLLDEGTRQIPTDMASSLEVDSVA